MTKGENINTWDQNPQPRGRLPDEASGIRHPESTQRPSTRMVRFTMWLTRGSVRIHNKCVRTKGRIVNRPIANKNGNKGQDFIAQTGTKACLCCEHGKDLQHIQKDIPFEMNQLLCSERIQTEHYAYMFCWIHRQMNQGVNDNTSTQL
jgi:hypothetical protein